ncbi:MAG TPA: reverse transcriptase domain-containing protein [Candidatus Dojkabacteria bacterium]|nr:reverse transcriptase domain-containing protein [Candidatus Dojkabacteria bacterium]
MYTGRDNNNENSSAMLCGNENSSAMLCGNENSSAMLCGNENSSAMLCGNEIKRINNITLSNTTAQKFTKRIIIMTYINNLYINTLIDPGAEACVMSTKFYQKHFILEFKLEQGFALQAVSGSGLNVRGLAWIPVRIVTTSLLVPFIISDDSVHDVLLGLNACEDFAIDIDFGRRIKCENTYIRYNNFQKNIFGVFVAKESVVIPAGHEALVPLILDNNSFSSHNNRIETIVVEDASTQPGVYCNMAGVMSLSQTNSHKIWVGNFRDEEHTINKGDVLCRINNTAFVNSITTNNSTQFDKFISELETRNDIPHSVRVQIRGVMEQFRTIFDDKVPKEGLQDVQHKIVTQDGITPFYTKLRRYSITEQEFIKNTIDKLLEEGVIRKGHGSWASAVVLATKKDGGIRFCVDYRKLNEITVKDVYPLPRIDVTLEHLSKMKIASKLDATSGYWHIQVKETDKEKTGFLTTFGLFEWNRMPFGLTNAPATFQRYMDNLLNDLRWRICLVYMDDVIIYSENYEQHLKDIQTVFKRFASVGMKLKLSKCSFFMKELVYLGHKVSAEGIAPDPQKIEAITRIPDIIPNLVNLRYFLGLTGYYRQFIFNYAATVQPLIHLTTMDTKWEWNDKHTQAVQHLKQKLMKQPVLAYMDPNKTIIVTGDSSEHSIGGTLEQDGHPIAYFSESLRSYMVNWTQTEKELYALVRICEKFRHWLHGRHFIVITDHEAIKFLQNKNANITKSRLIRWMITLSEFNMELKWKPGREIPQADALSRIINMVTIKDILQDNINAWRLQQLQDKELENIIITIEDKLNGYEELKQQGYFLNEDKILYITRRNKQQIMVPKHKRKEIFDLVHERAEHPGAITTKEKIEETYYWNNINSNVLEWYNACSCMAQRRAKLYGELHLIESQFPMEILEIDTAHMTNSIEEHKYLMVVKDHFSGYIWAWPQYSNTAQETAWKFFKRILCRMDAPKILISDRGAEFNNELILELAKLERFAFAMALGGRHQTVGSVERAIQTIKEHLRIVTNEEQNDWHTKVEGIVRALNRNPTRRFKFMLSPFEIMFGRKPNELSQIANGVSSQQLVRKDYQKVFNEIAQLHKIAQDLIAKYRTGMKQYHDKQRNKKNFVIGDKVWWKQVRDGKLGKEWQGVGVITRKENNYNFEVEFPDKTKKVMHVEDLKKYKVEKEEMKNSNDNSNLEIDVASGQEKEGKELNQDEEIINNDNGSNNNNSNNSEEIIYSNNDNTNNRENEKEKDNNPNKMVDINNNTVEDNQKDKTDIPHKKLDRISIGMRVDVWWPGMHQYYCGTVSQFRRKDEKYKILYDDGDIQFEKLERMKICGHTKIVNNINRKFPLIIGVIQICEDLN